MSKLSRKAILAVLSLVLTFVALGATTFAWFSLGTTATVEQFNVNVKGSEGLEINFDGKKGWFTTLNSARMAEYITGTDGVFEGKRLEAVTTATGHDGFLKMIGLTGTSVNTIGAVANTDYLEFTLNFRTKLENQTLKLTNLTLDSEGMNFEADTMFTNEGGTKINDLSGTVPSWEVFPHYGARVSLAGTATTIFQSGATGTNIDYDLTKGAHDYVAKKSGLAGTLTAPDSTFIDAVNNASTATSFDNLVTFGTPAEADGYFYAKVVVRVWLEGWDGNTYDALFDGSLQVSLAFELQ